VTSPAKSMRSITTTGVCWAPSPFHPLYLFFFDKARERDRQWEREWDKMRELLVNQWST